MRRVLVRVQVDPPILNRIIMKKLLAALLMSVTLLTGCATEVLIFEKAKALDTELLTTISTAYCAMPERLRVLNRNRINSAIAPNSIVLTCAD